VGDPVVDEAPERRIDTSEQIRFAGLEIPADMVQKHGFAPLGAADGAVKSAIFGYNSARLYKLDLRAELPLISTDKLTAARVASLHEATRSNLAYGYIARRA